MNRAYVPDNTRSSIAIVLSLAIAVGLIAMLVGLSDKPSVKTLSVAGSVAAAPDEETTTSETFGFDAENPPVEFDEAGDPIVEGLEVESSTADDGAIELPTSVQAPTAAPQPTPEVAAAVEPTPIPSPLPTPDPTSLPLSAAESDAAALRSGIVQGTFFTGGPDAEGAVITQNQIEVSFNTDGSGTFTGVLDITYAEGSRAYLEMSGDLVWTTGNPQVEAVVTGTYGFDAVVEADDIAAEEGELNITSLQSGSGALCAANRCFGFTFPPQL